MAVGVDVLGGVNWALLIGHKDILAFIENFFFFWKAKIFFQKN
jgi:hypothetical protein